MQTGDIFSSTHSNDKIESYDSDIITLDKYSLLTSFLNGEEF